MKGRNEFHPVTKAEQPDALRLLAHELGNVLNGMLGMTELLRSHDPRPEQERWLSALQQCGLQMNHLLEAFCGDRSGEKVSGEFDGIGMLENTITSHAPAARARGNTLLLMLAPDLPRSWTCSFRRLRQILDNLITNAIDYAPGAEILVTARAAHGVLELDVQDSGPGLRPAAVNQLFRPYQQNLHAHGPSSSGKGLGLHVCRVNADTMRGELSWFEPEAGGSCFRLTLPGAVAPSVRDRPLRPVRLLQSVCCELRLSGNLRRSVAMLLIRHGIIPLSPGQRRQEVSGRVVVVSAVAPPERSPVREIELRLQPVNASLAPRMQRLDLPILGSSLLEALLALVL